MQVKLQLGYYRALAAALMILSLGAATSCSAPKATPLEVKLNEMYTSRCSSVCKSIGVNFSAINSSPAMMCIPLRYLGSGIGRSLTILDGSTVANFADVSDPTDLQPDSPANHDPHVRMLRGEPNVVVLPNSQLQFVVDSGERYNIPKGNFEVVVQIYSYPCEEKTFQDVGFSSHTLRARIKAPS